MRLRGKRAFLLEFDHARPCFLSGRSIAAQRSRLAQRVQRFRHIRLPVIRALQFLKRLGGFPLLEQRCTQTISALGIAWPQLGLRAKLGFCFWPLSGVRVDLTEFEMEARQFGAQAKRLPIFSFGLRHLAENKVVFGERLMRPRKVWMRGKEGVDGALGEQPAGVSEIVEKIRV